MLHDNFDGTILWENAEFGVLFKLQTTMILFFCLGGEVTIEAENRNYTMHRGDVQFTMSGIFGTAKDMSKDVKFAAVFIDESFYFPLLKNADLSSLHLKLASSPICRLSEDKMQECISIYRLMKNRLEHHDNDLLQEDILRGYTHALVTNVYSQYLMTQAQAGEEVKVKGQGNRQQQLFSQFMSLLEKNYNHERNIKFYADKLCVTPRYLSRVVHDVSGFFASEHIDHFVIEEAKHLIRSKKYTILQVSDMLNFTSQSFFGRYFKKFTGFTPKQYEELG
jgi:AraC-like DNA-binding protein